MSRLKELIKEYNLSQRELLPLIGVKRDLITNIIQKRKVLDVDMIIKLSTFFNVSSDYFIGLTNHGIYVNVLDKVYAISEEQLNYYKKKKLIEYKDYKRILKVDSLDDIEIVNCNTQLVKIKNEIL